MKRVITGAEIYEEHLTLLGSELGFLYNTLHREVAWIYVKWTQYRKMFMHSVERHKLLRQSAGLFFRVIGSVLLSDILMHLSKLTDPPKTVGKENLTLKRLLPHMGDDKSKKQFAKRLQEIETAMKPVRDWRNQHGAHHTLPYTQDELSFDHFRELTLEEIDAILVNIEDLMRFVYCVKTSRDLSFDKPILDKDIDSLLAYLEIGLKVVETEKRGTRDVQSRR